MEKDNIIIDNSSMFNIMGSHQLPVLRGNLKEAGQTLQITPAVKSFKFGRQEEVSSQIKVTITINLGSSVYKMEVYIVPTRIPFLIGGAILRRLEANILIANECNLDQRTQNKP